MVFPFFSQFGKRKEYVRGRGGKEVWKERLGPNPEGPQMPISTDPVLQEQAVPQGEERVKGHSAHPEEASSCRTSGEGRSGRKAGPAQMEKGNRPEGRRGDQASGQGLPGDDGEEEGILRVL